MVKRTLRRIMPLLARAAILLGLGLTSVLIALALTPGTVRAERTRPMDAAISGTVVNGTHSGAVVANVQVTLQSLGANGTRDLASATTDAQGRFTFHNLPDGDAAVYAVYARFQQALFTTGAIAVQGGTQDVRLAVYDVTSSDAALRITSVTALVRDPRPVNGLIGVGEFFAFHNSGATAYLGSAQPANGKPMNLLRFALPAGAAHVTLGAGFDGAQSAQVATGFGAAATVPPGDSQFAFAFDLPYTGTQCLLPLKAEYPADAALLLVPPAIQVTPQGMEARGQITSNGEQYDAFTRGALGAGMQVSAQLARLPRAGEPPALEFGQLVALAGALALLLAALVTIYLRRGSLDIASRMLPGLRGHASRRASAQGGADDESEQSHLLGQLLALQRARELGRLSPAQFRRRSAEVRTALRRLLAATLAEPDTHARGAEAPHRQPATVFEADARVVVEHAVSAVETQPVESASEARSARTASGGGR